MKVFFHVKFAINKKKKFHVSQKFFLIPMLFLPIIGHCTTISASGNSVTNTTAYQQNAGTSLDWKFSLSASNFSAVSSSYALVTWRCAQNTSVSNKSVIYPEVRNTNYGFQVGCTSAWVRAIQADYTMINTSTSWVTVAISIHNYSDNNEAAPLNIALAPASNCSVDVAVTPNLGNLTPGTSVAAVNLTSNPIGNGSLVFKPDSYTANGGKITNGSNFLTYSITNATWNASSGNWSGTLSGSHGIKLADIPKSAVAGVYKGTMTATISCL